MINEFLLEKESVNLIQKYGLEKSTFLLAVSGGLDSVVLLHHFLQLRKKLNQIHIEVVHVHHGPSSQIKQKKYRDKCLDYLKKHCLSLGVPFHFAKSKKNLRSEEDFRNFRSSVFQEYAQNSKIIVTAHHSEDLFETQLLRLIRGTGPQGLKSMDIFNDNYFRPLLNWKKEDLSFYAKKFKLIYFDDPSNSDPKYLRNWIRNKWLKDLEKKVPGSLKAFQNSLKLLTEESESFLKSLEKHMSEQGISRNAFLFLNKREQRSLLALYLRKRNIKNYTVSHIDEVIKRLDSPGKIIKFQMLKLSWTIDTRHISAEPS